MLPPGDRRPRSVLMAGASGLLGSHLVRHLRRRGDTVRRLVRRAPRSAAETQWDPAGGSLPADALTGVDVIVNLGGAPLGSRRWTRAYRETILRSRVDGTALLARAAAREAHRRADEAGAHPAGEARALRFLQASAVGYYGDRGEEVLTEAAGPGEGFLADVCRQWEDATLPAEAAGVEVVHLRTGIVLAPRGGAMGPLLPLLKAGLGGPLGGGHQWWPWMSIADHVRAQLHLMDSSLTGPVNLAGPVAERQGAVIRLLARALGRPALLPVPAFALRIVLDGFADDVLASQRMVPTRLLADGFVFRHAHAHGAAAWIGARA